MALLGPDHSNLLYQAAKIGDISTIEALLLDPEVHAQATAQNNLALRTACKKGHLDIVNRLLQIDAVREQVTADDNGAFCLACEKGHLTVVKRLLQIEAVREQVTADDNCALREACICGQLEIVNYLLQIDAVREQVTASNNQALRWACLRGHLMVVNRLLQIDAVREQISADNNGALRWASAMGHIHVVNRLLDFKAVREHPSLPAEIQKQLSLIIAIKTNQLDAIESQTSVVGALSFYSALANRNPYVIEVFINKNNFDLLKASLSTYDSLSTERVVKLLNKYLYLILNPFNHALRSNKASEALTLLGTEPGRQHALAYNLYGLRLAAMKESHDVIKSILAIDEVSKSPKALTMLLEESHDKLSLEEHQMIAARFAPQMQASENHIGDTIANLNNRNNHPSSKALEEDAKVSDTKAELTSSRGKELDFAKALAAQFHDRLTDETLLLQLWTTLQIAFDDRAISACTSSSSGPSYSSSSSSSRACSSSSVYCVSDDATEAPLPAASFLPFFAATQAASSQEEASSQRLERQNQQDETMTEKKQRKH